MSFYNNIEGISAGFEICPITGEKASYNFRTSSSYDGFSYQIPSINPHTIVVIHYTLLNEASYTSLAKHRELIKKLIRDSSEKIFFIDRILVENLRRF